MKRIATLLLSLFLFPFNSSQAQNQEGLALEMFGAATAPINAFGSAFDYNGVADWTELSFEAGAGFSFRQYAGEGRQWGLKFTVSRLAFGYSETDYLDLNGVLQENQPVSTRRIYLNFEPVFAFRLAEGSGVDLDLETGIGVKLPVNAYTLARDAGDNNVDVNDFDRYSYGALTVFRAQVAPCLVWSTTRLSFFGAYQMSSGLDWELLSGWSAGVNITYFIEE
jgi:hypothetical protein